MWQTRVYVVWYVRLFGVLRENALCAHDITYADHYEKSLLRDNDSRYYLHKIKIISSDWIALLRKLLMNVSTAGIWYWQEWNATKKKGNIIIN